MGPVVGEALQDVYDVDAGEREQRQSWSAPPRPRGVATVMRHHGCCRWRGESADIVPRLFRNDDHAQAHPPLVSSPAVTTLDNFENISSASPSLVRPSGQPTRAEHNDDGRGMLDVMERHGLHLPSPSGE